MLWFVGLGISGPDGIGLDTLQILKEADIVFFEVFTSPIPQPELLKIKKMVKDMVKKEYNQWQKSDRRIGRQRVRRK